MITEKGFLIMIGICLVAVVALQAIEMIGGCK